jgi:hypothetical protein
MTVEEILPRFQGVEGGNGRWTARCPAHDDNRNSLSIGVRADDGAVLLHCHCDCVKADILQAVGLEFRDLFPARTNGHHGTNGKANGSSRGTLVKAYDYRDASGALVYQACRFEPKNFIQRRPDGNGGWTYNLQGIKPVPYRLPEILAAGIFDAVFVAEGEKDCDYLAALGLVATCNSGGAGKWKPEFAEWLADRDVYVLPDNDEAGEKHAQQVAASVHGKASSVRIVRLPGLSHKGDVSDWLAAGGTKNELLQLCEAAELWTPIPEALPRLPVDAATERNGSTRPKAITNARIEQDADGKAVITPMPMAEIVESIQGATDNWPRRVGHDLFAHVPGGAVTWLQTTDALLGWLGTITGQPPRFKRDAALHSPAHVFHELRRLATEYSAVETLPHEPAMQGHYYACGIPDPGDGSALDKLVFRFNPETPEDADLIRLMFVTLFWGGRSGSRPAFVFTAEAGRGVGKTSCAEMAGHLAGGIIELSANEDASVMKQRLLSPEGITRRVALLDNVKSHKFSWAELEALITAPVISGKRLYVGEASRPNNLVFAVTLNGVSLSKDLAQRSVIIKLRKPTHSGTWKEETRRLIDENRAALIADCIAFLRGQRFPLTRYSRWGAWEHDVLERMDNAADLQSLILERQDIADVECEEFGILTDYFRGRLAALHYDLDTDAVFLPSAVVGEWYCKATNERLGVTAVSRRLKQAIGEGMMPSLSVVQRKDWGRGFVWWGDSAPADAHVSCDIETRLDTEDRR